VARELDAFCRLRWVFRDGMLVLTVRAMVASSSRTLFA